MHSKGTVIDEAVDEDEEAATSVSFSKAWKNENAIASDSFCNERHQVLWHVTVQIQVLEAHGSALHCLPARFLRVRRSILKLCLLANIPNEGP